MIIQATKKRGNVHYHQKLDMKNLTLEGRTSYPSFYLLHLNESTMT